MAEKTWRKKKPEAFCLVALGCPKNLVDTELIAGGLLKSGYVLSFDPDQADVYIVNTCAFLPAARKEAEAEIATAMQWKRLRDGRLVVVCGCLTEYDKIGGEYRSAFPGVDFWVPVNDICRVAEIIAGRGVSMMRPFFLNDDRSSRIRLTLSHLAYLKIADGCDNHCSYCAIPSLRGQLRTRPSASVVREAEMLISGGAKELVVVAQDVTAYGKDRPGEGENLCSLLKQLEELEGDFSLRLLYTHPTHYTEELVEFLSSSQRVLPYLDVPLQHISDRILNAMNRRITRMDIEALLDKLRTKIPHLTLRTTFIVGFPGESEEEFSELARFVRDFKFERMGVFPYAAEERTVAARLPDQVPADIAAERAAVLMRRQVARMKRRNRRLVGSTDRVLVDVVGRDGYAVARGAMDAPEIDNVVLIPHARGVHPGDRVDICYTGVSGCDMVAQLTRTRSGRSV